MVQNRPHILWWSLKIILPRDIKAIRVVQIHSDVHTMAKLSTDAILGMYPLLNKQNNIYVFALFVNIPTSLKSLTILKLGLAGCVST